MKANATPMLDLVPQQVDRALRALLSTDSFRDQRSTAARLFGPRHFTWTTGWLTVDRASYPFVHMSAAVPHLTEARSYLAARFHLVRLEPGLLDNRRLHPFMIAVISGAKELA